METMYIIVFLYGYDNNVNVLPTHNMGIQIIHNKIKSNNIMCTYNSFSQVFDAYYAHTHKHKMVHYV